MNKKLKEHLLNLVEATINKDDAGAKAAFHEYARLKSQFILGEANEADDDKDDKKSDDKEDKKSDDKKED